MILSHLKPSLIAGAALTFCSLTLSGAALATEVQFKTSVGDFKVELNDEKAPATVANFLKYVDSGFYEGLVFHRVIDNFMIQGGGFDQNLKHKKTPHKPIANEADNGLKNNLGTIAMARTSDPHSATSQFFINAKDNDFLNHTSKTSRGWGYTVFGQVSSGLSVVKQIEATATGSRKGMRDVPRELPVILSVKRVK